MLKAEVSGNGKDKGPTLIAEALNLLFKKYGKPHIIYNTFANYEKLKEDWEV
jgi:hypothetical protein